MSSGILLANPVPLEYSLSKEEIDRIIDQATQQAEAQGISGNENTPFVLAKIKELSGGKSVTSNIALVESNVKRGTKVAVELANIESGHKVREDR